MSEIFGSTCPVCRTWLDGASEIRDADEGWSRPPATPKPGDVSVCVYCASIIVLRGDGQWREPTELEFVEFRSSRTLVATQNAVARVIAERDGCAGCGHAPHDGVCPVCGHV